MTENKIFIECGCGNEGLLVTEFIEFFPEDRYNQEFYLAMFGRGLYRRKPNLWERIKHCWYHLWTGNIHDDELIMGIGDAGKLLLFLQENLLNVGSKRIKYKKELEKLEK